MKLNSLLYSGWKLPHNFAANQQTVHSFHNERTDALVQRCIFFVLCHSGPRDINKCTLQLHCWYAWLIPKYYYRWPEVNTHWTSSKTYKQTSRLYAQTIPSVRFFFNFNLPLFLLWGVVGGWGVSPRVNYQLSSFNADIYPTMKPACYVLRHSH